MFTKPKFLCRNNIFIINMKNFKLKYLKLHIQRDKYRISFFPFCSDSKSQVFSFKMLTTTSRDKMSCKVEKGS